MAIAAEIGAFLQASTVEELADELALANTATFQTSTQSKALVKAGSVADIQSLIHYCRQHKKKIFCISQGKNWGFGSKVPPVDVDVLLDLSPMKGISHYDPRFGSVRCEPGVTFQQLADYLKTNGNQHFVNAIGGDPGASVLGNALVRGDGVGPYAERAEYMCALEVVLADGQCLDLSTGEGPLRDLLKVANGPGLQELFIQSGLGIVVGATVWLAAVPAHFRMIQFRLGENHSIGAVIDQFRGFYQRRVLTGPFTFWNDYKQIANTIQYPWSYAPQPPLTRETAKIISNGYSTWRGFGGIYVDDETISRATAQAIFSGLAGMIQPMDALSELDALKVNALLAEDPLRYAEIGQIWAENPLLGHVGNSQTRSVYWRKRIRVPEKIAPEKDRCGLLWNAFFLPMQGTVVESALTQLDELILSHKFEPIVSFITVNDRYLRVFQQLIFDRDVPGEDARALECHRLVYEWLEDQGFRHARTDILHRSQHTSHTILDALKKNLDPDGILTA